MDLTKLVGLVVVKFLEQEILEYAFFFIPLLFWCTNSLQFMKLLDDVLTFLFS